MLGPTSTRQLTTAQAAELTLPQLLELGATRRGQAVALRQGRLGGWEDWTWTELSEAAADFGSALLDLGLERGDRIALICRPRVEALIAVLGAQGAGCVPFGIYPPTPDGAAIEILESAVPKLLVCDSPEKAVAVMAHRRGTASPLTVAVLDGEPVTAGTIEPSPTTWVGLCERGAARRVQRQGEWEANVAEGGPDDVSSLYYTSGTTGQPKGALLSSRNLIISYLSPYGDGPGRLPAPTECDRTIHEIPVASAAGPWFGLLIPLVFGCVTYIPDAQVDPDVTRRQVQPTIYFGSPRVWEVCASQAAQMFGEGPALRRWAYWVTMFARERIVEAAEAGGRPALPWRVVDRLITRRALRVVLRRWGLGELRYAMCSGASTAPHVVRRWHLWGVVLRELYGMTESGGLATMVIDPIPRPGTAGRAIPNMEMRVDEAGEILLRGPGVFAGYLNMPEATAAAIDDDGWLHSGDLGEMLGDGSLRVLGRKTDLIATTAGQTVMASQIESALTESRYVRHAIAIGNDRPDVTALIELDIDEVRSWARDHDVDASDYSDLAAREPVKALIRREIETSNMSLREAGRPAIRTFRLFPRELDLTDPEVATATRKIRRRNLMERHGRLIAEMYEAAPTADRSP